MTKQAKRQPVYLRVRKLVDPETGQMVPAMVPAGAADATTLRERGIKTGQQLRADITLPRNYAFHKLGHRLADLARENLPGFEGLDAHEAFKRLQRESEVECDVTLTEIPGVGTLRSVQPRSMAFDRMDQGAFYQMVRGIAEYIAREYWPQCSPEEIEQMIELMPEETA